jgi:hypothetical protein
MSVTRPYYRTCRQFSDGSYSEGGRWRYIVHPKYAKSPQHYVRAFLLIQKDVQALFDYVEPADANLKCFSFRIQELLFRACVEVEANLRAIILENGYEKKNKKGHDLNLNIKDDYVKLENTHRLSSYKAKVPLWHGSKSIRIPFENWGPEHPSPAWYRAYNKSKHDRYNEFEGATFEQMIDAVCGLFVVLSSQFHTQDFAPGASHLVTEDQVGDGMENGIGDYFRVYFPDDWPADDRYEFDWETIKNDQNPFRTIDYTPSK